MPKVHQSMRFLISATGCIWWFSPMVPWHEAPTVRRRIFHYFVMRGQLRNASSSRNCSQLNVHQAGWPAVSKFKLFWILERGVAAWCRSCLDLTMRHSPWPVRRALLQHLRTRSDRCLGGSTPFLKLILIQAKPQFFCLGEIAMIPLYVFPSALISQGFTRGTFCNNRQRSGWFSLSAPKDKSSTKSTKSM